jgi:hypothetical protein
MLGFLQKKEWKNSDSSVSTIYRCESYSPEIWERCFYDLGYCNCDCHNHAKRLESHHIWGECQCYHPGKVYHDNGVLIADPIRLLLVEHYDDSLKHDGGATAGVRDILQTSIIRAQPNQKHWYEKVLDSIRNLVFR